MGRESLRKITRERERERERQKQRKKSVSNFYRRSFKTFASSQNPVCIFAHCNNVSVTIPNQFHLFFYASTLFGGGMAFNLFMQCNNVKQKRIDWIEMERNILMPDNEETLPPSTILLLLLQKFSCVIVSTFKLAKYEELFYNLCVMALNSTQNIIITLYEG